ncbi:hypothetical protein [Clostridium culturomicium]|mgnify:CR=1 FL=1|uniref:hypothetical protein n=1 Tax=Clostridium culturomicium TaxID=1499683 RepID=UPI000AFBA911|nr:hypothetical protein [Clostridium culturomicium]
MNMLNLKKDMKDKHGNVLLKANTAYFPKGEEVIKGKKYLIYDSEIKNEEILIPASNL